MKKVLLIGHRGNMGRRYAAILNYLGAKWAGVEYYDYIPDSTNADGIIIATPTSRHLENIELYSRFKIPILCEKPICKNQQELERLLDIVDAPLQMINQYKFFDQYQEIDKGENTLVNYYNTGTDGLIWDCINLIGLAKEDVHLYNTSPIWTVMLNGTYLDKRFIDNSYISNISDWLYNPVDGKDYIRHAHNRIFEYEKNTSSNSYPGTPIFIQATR